MIKEIPHTITLVDFSFAMWFQYRLWCQPKVSTNLGFDFGIRSKPKQCVELWSHALLITFQKFCFVRNKKESQFLNCDSSVLPQY